MQNKRMRFHGYDRLKIYCLYAVFISIFFVGFYVRNLVLPSTFAAMDLIGAGACFALLVIRYKQHGVRMSLGEFFGFLAQVLLLLLYLYTSYETGAAYLRVFRCFIGLNVPMLLLGVVIDDASQLVPFYQRIYRVLQGIVLVILGVGVIDYVVGGVITATIGRILNASTITYNATVRRRLASYLGHPLFNTEVFIIYFGLSTAYRQYIDKGMKPWYVAVSLLGVLLTGSKTGLVLVLVATLVLYVKNIRWLIAALVAIAVLYFLGFFDLVITRFTSETLTSNRNEKWNQIISVLTLDFNLFSGHGPNTVFGLNRLVSRASAAFEYPLRLFLYEYGVVFTLLIAVVLFVVPLVQLVRRRQFTMLVVVGMLMVDVNTYNGIGVYQDHLYCYCLALVLMMNLSRAAYAIERRKKRTQQIRESRKGRRLNAGKAASSVGKAG